MVLPAGAFRLGTQTAPICQGLFFFLSRLKFHGYSKNPIIFPDTP
jgi:hypothetical protein